MSVPGKLVLPIFLVMIFAGAMVLGPLIYFVLDPLWHVPLHRAMDRALLISAVLALGMFWSRIPFAKLWPLERDAWLQLLLGYVIALVSIQAMLGFNLALAGFTSAHRDTGQIAERVLLALVAAVFAPLLEETVFRGFVQGELVRGLGWRGGVVLGAVIFMFAHFLKIPVELDHEPVHLWSGVTAIGAAFTNFGSDLTRPDNLGKALNLLLVGLILGGVVLRTGSLWLNAGLHSGWIFGLLLFTGLTHPIEPPRYAWAGGDILSSLTTTVVLMLTGLWLWRYYRHPSIVPEVPRASGSSAP